MVAIADRAVRPRPSRRHRPTPARSGLWRVPPVIWVFLGLGAAMEAFWVAWPALNTFYYSFTRWDGIGKKVWVGAGNYQGILHDPVFGKALVDNCIWVVGFGGLSLLFGLLFALALDRPRRGVGAVPSTHISSAGILTRRDGAVLADVLYAWWPVGLVVGSDRAAEPGAAVACPAPPGPLLRARGCRMA